MKKLKQIYLEFKKLNNGETFKEYTEKLYKEKEVDFAISCKFASLAELRKGINTLNNLNASINE